MLVVKLEFVEGNICTFCDFGIRILEIPDLLDQQIFARFICRRKTFPKTLPISFTDNFIFHMATKTMFLWKGERFLLNVD